jgi:hypothetical protein
MEFYSATKNEILLFSRELENIILSEVSQTQKAKNCIVSLICRLYNKNKCSNIIALGLHAKGITDTGGIGKGKET